MSFPRDGDDDLHVAAARRGSSSPLSAVFVAVSNTCDNFEVRLDGAMTVKEARDLVVSKLNVANSTPLMSPSIKMSLRGIQLVDDAAMLQEVVPADVFRDSERLHISVVNGSGTSGANLPKGLVAATRREEDAAMREQARAMEPMIDMMVRNPQFVDSMFASQPEIQQLIRSNPDMARELRNPEFLKNMILSQVDPDQKRQMSRTMQLQMAQIANIPGGTAMLERHMHSFMQQPAGRRSRADLQDATEEHARPDDQQQSNSEALPNPWGAAAAAPPLSTMPLPSIAQRTPPASLIPFPANHPPSTPYSSFPIPLSSLFPSGISSTSSQTATAAAVPHVRREFPDQLEILLDMGFEDLDLCMEALDVCNGDVDAAVCYIDDHKNSNSAP